MTELRIARLRKRYRLPEQTARDERARLDRVLALAIDGELIDAALERAGIPSTDEICIRRVASAARLRSSDRDTRLAVQWSIALAEAIAATLRAGGPDVVRYRSRNQALVDMMCSAARGDLSRTWAWRQLGIWSANDALSPTAARAEAVEALAMEPRAAPAVLHAVADAGLLTRLIAGASAERWMRLARAALVACDASAPMLGALDETMAPTAAAPRATVDRVVARSAILRAASRIGYSRVTARALAVLSFLECEPDLAADGQPEIVRALADRIAHAGARSAADRGDAPHTRESDADAADPRKAHARANRKTNATAAASAGTPDVAGSSDDAPPDERAQGITTHGGLLFLLHLIGALGVPTLPGRSLRWTMHRLALMLAAIEADDPAALAFAGLAPGSRPPSDSEPPETDAERVELAALRLALVDSLRARLDAPLDESDDALVLRVVTRRADVVADLAWIELRFSMADATTDVRRAALDCDPGWIPWLGVVMRFVYA